MFQYRKLVYLSLIAISTLVLYLFGRLGAQLREAPPFPENIRLRWNRPTMYYAIAYCSTESIMTVRSLVMQGGLCCKISTTVIAAISK
jgi:hypothetical protein